MADEAWRRRTSTAHKYVPTDACMMHGIDLGRGDPLVLIHGYADSAYSWHKNDEALRALGFRTIMVDQPGLGKSGTPGPGYRFTVGNQAEAVLRFVDGLGIDRFDLVGHSMGGGVALLLAMRYASRVGKVVAISPACFSPPRRPVLSYPLMDRVARRLPRRLLIARGLRAVRHTRAGVERSLESEYVAAAARRDFIESLRRLSCDYFDESHAAMAAAYGELDRPLLIIWGADDPWLPVRYGERLRQMVDGSMLRVLPRTGHVPHQENADEVNRMLAGFLAAQRS